MKTYLARVACLGQWTLNNLNLNNGKKIVHNHQKVRVDMFTKVATGQLKKTNASEALKYIKRPDIKNAILSQEDMLWLKTKAPSAIIMDSFAELTDQFFLYKKDNWGFCSNYSDINHSIEFNKNFHKKGLLSTNAIYDEYNKFFSFVRKEFDCPIAFIHFPTTLDSRELFKNRYNNIYDAISQIKSKYNILSIEADEGVVEPRINSHEAVISSPYHFSNATIKHFSDKIKAYGKIS